MVLLHADDNGTWLAWSSSKIVQSFGLEEEEQSARGKVIVYPPTKAKGRVIEKKKDLKKASADGALPTMRSIMAVVLRTCWLRGVHCSRVWKVGLGLIPD